MKKSVVKPIISALLFIAVLTAAFCAGCGLSLRDWFIRTVEKNYYYPVDDGFYDERDLKLMAQNYLDRYSAYYTKSEYEEVLKSNAGSKSGIGITYSFVDGRGVYISSVIGNSPAYKCGLRAGDWLESGSAEGGEKVVFSSSGDFSGLVTSVGDGTPMTFLRTTGDSVTVAKSEYTASYTYLYTNSIKCEFKDAVTGGLAMVESFSDEMEFLPDGFAYIRLSQFYGTAAAEFYKLIEKFNSLDCKSLILDLRTNGGGYVSVMQEIAYSFSGSVKEVAMVARYKGGSADTQYCVKGKNAQVVPKDTQIYVMANSGTASASEALIGCMVCYGSLRYENIFLSDYSEDYMSWLKSTDQELKTKRTYGKGIMQTTFVKNSGEALKLTTAQIYWPDGTTCIHEKGVTAEDGCRTLRAEWQHTRGDEELQLLVDTIK